MRRKASRWFLVISALVVLALGGCASKKQITSPPTQPSASKGQTAVEEGRTQKLSLATAAAGGGWYAGGVAIADLLSKEIEGLKVTAEETGGGVENVRLLSSGSVDMAFINADAAVAARRGQKPFKAEENLLSNAMVAWQLYDNQIHIVARADSGIRTIRDVKGKSFNIGPPGSSGAQVSEEVLKAHGLTTKDIAPVFLPWNEAADALVDGKIDVGILAGGAPAPAVEGLAARIPINFLKLDPKTYDTFRKQGLYITTIPANTYKGQTEPVDLLTWRPYVFVRQDLSEDLVYRMVKVVMENKEQLAKIYKPSVQITVPSKETIEELGFQLHPGTLRYLSTAGK